ncbi:hypothetical protein DY000_02007189 [Brassica cretica]|uniref:Uncharacterized protein n=1 Tax=Brassica cretica TaxID=69181 RepID=A0ABQ7BTX0_BRACR|nr:hypothetical protein DY000_02007189 [Brassica cretica]
MAATKIVFHHMVLIFHSFEGFSDLEDFWDDLLVSRLKYNALEDFQDDLLVSRLKYNTLENFQDDLPGSLLAESFHMSPFHNRSERFDGSHLHFTTRKRLIYSMRKTLLQDSAALWRTLPHAASEKLTPSRLFLMESPVPSPSSSAPIDPGGASPARSRRRSRSRALARERALSSPPEIGNVKDLVLPVVKYSEVKTDVLKNLVVKDSPACEVSVEGSVSAEKQVAVDEVQLEEGEICEDPRGAKEKSLEAKEVPMDDLESSRSSRLSPKIV